MLGLILKIAGAVLALVIGVYLGLPGRYTQTPTDIERVMERGGGRRQKVKRVFTPLAWVQRNVSSKALRSTRGGFKVKSPDDR